MGSQSDTTEMLAMGKVVSREGVLTLTLGIKSAIRLIGLKWVKPHIGLQFVAVK